MVDEFPFDKTRIHALKHWMRHMAIAPKGFLRYQLLKMLKEKSMSGSEIMDEVEKQTDGCWRPSPGSIYPLLAWLQDKGYIKETTDQGAGVKRYMLTEQGKIFLDNHIKAREELNERFKHFGYGPGFLGLIGFEFCQETKELFKAFRDLGFAVWSLHQKLSYKYSQKAVEDAKRALEEATNKIKGIANEGNE